MHGCSYNCVSIIHVDQEFAWLLEPLVKCSPSAPYSVETHLGCVGRVSVCICFPHPADLRLQAVWEILVKEQTSNLDDDTILLHVNEIKVMLQCLGFTRDAPAHAHMHMIAMHMLFIRSLRKIRRSWKHQAKSSGKTWPPAARFEVAYMHVVAKRLDPLSAAKLRKEPVAAHRRDHGGCWR